MSRRARIGTCAGPADAALVRAMLSARGIPAVVGAENHSSMLGGLGGGFLSLDIWVAEEDSEEAAALLRDLREPGPGAEDDDDDGDEGDGRDAWHIDGDGRDADRNRDGRHIEANGSARDTYRNRDRRHIGVNDSGRDPDCDRDGRYIDADDDGHDAYRDRDRRHIDANGDGRDPDCDRDGRHIDTAGESDHHDFDGVDRELAHSLCVASDAFHLQIDRRRRTSIALLLGCCLTFGTAHMFTRAWLRGLALGALELFGIVQLAVGHRGGTIAIVGAVAVDMIGAVWRIWAAQPSPIPEARVRRRARLRLR